ncbi:MAG: hypothetical protein KAG97_05875, partial [Victivallales bacterium]|nr:hypothetical protein [Victivallales bacterium]
IFAESGSEGLLNVLNSAVDFFDFVLADAKAQNDVSSPWGKSAITDRMLGLIGHLTKDVLRAEYASKLAAELQLPESAVFQELNKNNRRDAMKASFSAAKKQARATAKEESDPTPPTFPETNAGADSSSIPKAEAYLLELALSHGTVGRELAEELPHDMITKTPLGTALNMVISMTLNDEWDQAGIAVRNFLTENPDQEISRVLAAPELFRDDTDEAKELRRKALLDCVRCIKLHHSKAETKGAKSDLSSQEALLAFQEKLNKRRALEPEKKKLKPKKRQEKEETDELPEERKTGNGEKESGKILK